MSAEEEYREFIRIKKNIFVLNVMRKYLEIMYDRKKCVHTEYTKSLDKEMLKTLVQELNKFMEDFIK